MEEEYDYNELVCEECKTCKYYGHQIKYCAGDEEPCADRKPIEDT